MKVEVVTHVFASLMNSLVYANGKICWMFLMGTCVGSTQSAHMTLYIIEKEFIITEIWDEANDGQILVFGPFQQIFITIICLVPGLKTWKDDISCHRKSRKEIHIMSFQVNCVIPIKCLFH